MARKKEENIYCVFYGAENNNKNEKCIKCKKDLHPKNHLFKDYLYDHIKDNLKDKVTDNVFSYIKNYIISHLYGTVMFVSVVFSTVMIITYFGRYNTIRDVSEMRTTSNSNEVTIRVYTYDDTCAKDFDSNLVDIPFAVAGTISGLKRVVQEVTIEKGTNISEWCKNDHENELICQEDLMVYDTGIEKLTNAYREKILAYADWVRTNGTDDSDAYAKLNYELEDLSYEIFMYDKLKDYDKNSAVKNSLNLYVPEVGCMYEDWEG